MRYRTTTALIAICLATALLSACGGRAGNAPASGSDAVRRAFGSQSPTSAPGAGGSVPSSPTNTIPPGTGKPTSGSAALQEPEADALKFGNAPLYAEIQAASLRGKSRTISFVLTVADVLPEQMPDAQTTLRAGFRMKVGDSPYVLSANASSQGWETTATKDGKGVAFPGSVQRDGATLTFVVPWAFFGGPAAFTWTGFAAWDQSAAVRSYSVDIIPNAGEAPFPQA